VRSKQKIIEFCRIIDKHFQPVFIDTETTGLGRSAEFITFSAVDDLGNILLDVIGKPRLPSNPDATAIHGYTEDILATKEATVTYKSRITNLVTGRCLVAYNAPFDYRILSQSFQSELSDEKHEYFNAPFLMVIDCMRLFAEFVGSNKNIKLKTACEMCGIDTEGVKFHGSLADAEMTRKVFQYMANYVV